MSQNPPVIQAQTPEPSPVTGSLRVAMSPHINELAAALAKAQGGFRVAATDGHNPHFKSRYATLASILSAAQPALSQAGLAVIQSPSVAGKTVSVQTILAHGSGQWIACTLSADAKDTGPQAIGSVISYLRRYGLASLLSIATGEDDDGEEATAPPPRRQPTRVAPTGGQHSPAPPRDTPTREAAISEYQPHMQAEAAREVQPNPDIHPGEGWVGGNRRVRKVIGDLGITDPERKAILARWGADSSMKLTGSELHSIASALEGGVTDDDKSFERDAILSIEDRGDDPEVWRTRATGAWEVVLLERLLAKMAGGTP